MFQGESICSEKNWLPFPFTPSDLNAVFVTHAHYDHTGRLPVLVRNGFKGVVYSTPPTQALAKLILDDALRVSREEAERCGREPLFEAEDVKALGDLMQSVNYHTEIEPVPGARVMFHNAGHILGSSYVSIDFDAALTSDGQKKRLVFSGDLGNENIPILPNLESLEGGHVVVCESTYGNRDHSPVSARGRQLEEFASKVLKRGGTLIIPAFSVERTQELLYELDQLIDERKLPNVAIYLDSPLAIRSTQIYRDFKHYLSFDRSVLSSPDRDFFAFPRLRETLSVDESKSINNDRRSKIIISGSGMMNGGRVQHHLMRYLPDAKSGVMIIGYQADGTLGRDIQNGAKLVTINEQEIPIEAEIFSVDSFSAHADRNVIASWLNTSKELEKVYLVHGDKEVKKSFQEFLKARVRADIVIPDLDTTLTF